ncbi:MAG: hypothetical protein ACJ735_04785 [Actinomycetes bacterium]
MRLASRTIKRRLVGFVVLAAAGTLAAAAFTPGSTAEAGTGIGFGKPVFVDTHLAGGEPFVIHSRVGHDLIYSAHEGTTHLFRDGAITAPTGVTDFVTNYRNQVNIWTSHDDGKSWQRVDFNGTGFFTNPTYNTGFSDPDLTEDAGGVIYDTGIDLVNDALFSTPDGGKTWPTGTVQCHDGDRPWLAGGHKNEVFLATNTNTGGHTVFRSTDAGHSCGSFGIEDFGHGYTGYGKLYYDPTDGSIVEPVEWTDGGVTAVGVGVLPHASQAFDTQSGHFTVHKDADTADELSFFQAIGLDKAGTIYQVWAPHPRQPHTRGGCGGVATPLPNSVELAYSTDKGVHWSKPLALARPGTTVLWPWVQAGDAGQVSVVWYQYDRLTDPDCGSGNVSVYDANIYNATDPAKRQIQVANVVGRPVHSGGICQGGTACVATGQDRRLGDYFTNALDSDGCVLVATGDTTMLDPMTHQQLPTSRPLFIKQSRGMGLYGKPCVAAASVPRATKVTVPVSGNRPLATTGLPLALPLIALALVLSSVVVRRRRSG